jgi:DNA-binding response OmpR family regulator
MAELRVLVCDDDSDMLELMLRRLDKMGFKPDRAGDGGVAQALIKENLYDLIVTDIYMPEATGLELLQLAKQRDPQVQVVIVTASATLDNAIHALNQGAFGYLSKPFDHLSVFDSTVSRALEFRQLVLANRRMAEAQKMRGDMLEDEVAKRVGQLREKQQGLLDLLNCLPDGIVVVEEGGKLLMTSPAAEQWLARERRSEQQPISEFLGQVHSEWAESSGYAQLGEDSLKLLSVDYPHPNGKNRKAVIIRRAEEEEKESAGPGTLAVQSMAAIKEGLAWLFRQQLTGPMQQRIMAIAKHINLLEQLTGGAEDSARPVTSSAPVLEPASLPEYLLHEPMLDEPGAQWEEADLATARENGKQPAVDHGLLEPDTQPSRALATMQPIEEIEAVEPLPEIVEEAQPELRAEAAAEGADLLVQPEPTAASEFKPPEAPAAVLPDDLASAPTRVLSRREAAAQQELEAAPILVEQAQLEEQPAEPEPEPAAELLESPVITEPAQPQDTGRIPLWRRFSKGRGDAQEPAAAAAEAKARKAVEPRYEPEIREPEPQQAAEPVDDIEELEPEPESLAEVAARLEALIERGPEPEEPAVKPRTIRAKASIASAKAKAVVEARAARSVPAQKGTIREPEPAPAAAPPSPARGKRMSWPPNLPSQDPDFNPELDVSG